MKKKCECVLYVLSLFLVSIVGLFVFFGFPEKYLLYPAYALGAVIFGKIIVELFIHDFHIKRDPHVKENTKDELLKLECDVKDYNFHIFIILLLWLGLILTKFIEIHSLMGFVIIAEKILVASLIILSIFIFFSLIDLILDNNKNKQDLRVQNNHTGVH